MVGSAFVLDNGVALEPSMNLMKKDFGRCAPFFLRKITVVYCICSKTEGSAR